ncbi:hypothetical protein GOB27_14475 [Sinorhizobium meliloti]|nr:hypothetical protein [Sinorhizobium meliloti]
MSEKDGERSSGVDIGGFVGSVGGDIVGRDKTAVESTQRDLGFVFQTLLDAARTAPPEHQQEAEEMLAQLRAEVGKGKQADDGVVAKLMDGFVTLVPTAVTAVAGAFATPLLAGLAGPVTKFVLERIQAR